MYKYLLKQLDSSLIWVQAAAHGSAWFGYTEDMNQADAVKQILRLHIGHDTPHFFCIELWQRGRQSEFTLHSDNSDETIWLINQLVKAVKKRGKKWENSRNASLRFTKR